MGRSNALVEVNGTVGSSGNVLGILIIMPRREPRGRSRFPEGEPIGSGRKIAVLSQQRVQILILKFADEVAAEPMAFRDRLHIDYAGEDGEDALTARIV
jgi:hypothetical protein